MPGDFDELNNLTSDGEEFSYEEYFASMEIPDEEKEKRISLAKELEKLFLYFFLVYSEKQPTDYKKLIHDRYNEIALGFLGLKTIPSYIDSYARQLSNEVVRVTKEHEGQEFYLSKERGMLLSANESNMLGNYNQHIQAIKEGKRYKTWVTEKDRKVRHTHRAVDEKRIGIFELFEVGDSVMGYPKDMTHSPSGEEYCNCRCVVKYS